MVDNICGNNLWKFQAVEFRQRKVSLRTKRNLMCSIEIYLA